MNEEPEMDFSQVVCRLEELLNVFPSELNVSRVFMLQRAYRVLLREQTAKLPPASTLEQYEAFFREKVGKGIAATGGGRQAMQQGYNFREERREVIRGQIIKIQAKIDRLGEAMELVDQPRRFRKEMERIIAVPLPLKPTRRV